MVYRESTGRIRTYRAGWCHDYLVGGISHFPSGQNLGCQIGHCGPRWSRYHRPLQEETLFWLRTLLFSTFDPYAATDLQRDIVIEDPTRNSALFREGPYDAITVVRPLERILNEIGEVGLEQFLSRRRDPTSQPGPIVITRETDVQIYERAMATEMSYRWRRLVRAVTRRG